MAARKMRAGLARARCVGWGLSGICPGPALILLVSLDRRAWLFVGGMLVGMLLARAYLQPRRAPAGRGAVPRTPELAACRT